MNRRRNCDQNSVYKTWILPEWVTLSCSSLTAHICPPMDKKDKNVCSSPFFSLNQHKDIVSLWSLRQNTRTTVWRAFISLYSNGMDKRWSGRRRRRRGRRRSLFTLVAQRQDVFLQVGDPLLLNRQRSVKHLITEPGRAAVNPQSLKLNPILPWMNHLCEATTLTYSPTLEGVNFPHQLDQRRQRRLWQHSRDVARPWRLPRVRVAIFIPRRHSMLWGMGPWNREDLYKQKQKKHLYSILLFPDLLFLTSRRSVAVVLPARLVLMMLHRRVLAPARHRVRIYRRRGQRSRSLGLKEKKIRNIH